MNYFLGKRLTQSEYLTKCEKCSLLLLCGVDWRGQGQILVQGINDGQRVVIVE